MKEKIKSSFVPCRVSRKSRESLFLENLVFARGDLLPLKSGNYTYRKIPHLLVCVAAEDRFIKLWAAIPPNKRKRMEITKDLAKVLRIPHAAAGPEVTKVLRRYVKGGKLTIYCRGGAETIPLASEKVSNFSKDGYHPSFRRLLTAGRLAAEPYMFARKDGDLELV